MNKKQKNIIQKVLGNDIFEALEKAEIGIYKERTKSVVEPLEIKIALQVVPRMVLSYLYQNLKHLDIDAVINLDLPFAANCKLQANKLSPDNYSGELYKDNKKLIEFKHRTLPGIGLIIMSSLELYDIDQLDNIKGHDCHCEKADKLQDIIDERLRLHCLIANVVNQKITEREAISQLIQSKLNQHIEMINKPEELNPKPIKEPPMESKPVSKLKEFLENKEKKHNEINKGEIKCKDCGSILLKNGDDKINLCICYGEFMGKEVKLEKDESNKIKLVFPKNFGIDNIDMLIENLKNKK